jgi:hypothetical protein
MDERLPMMVSQELLYMAIWGYKVDTKTAELEIEELYKKGDSSFIPQLKETIEKNNGKISELEAIMSEHWNVSNVGGMR